jgi:saccharopine dehydrogenase-like NADP-dependent oxidoreductase
VKVLVVGAGGVGSAFAAIAQRRPVFSQVVLADISLERAQAAAQRLGEPDRFGAERVDASDRSDVAALIGRVGPDAVLNATDPRFNEQIFEAAFESRVTYLDMAMTLSHPHPKSPYELPGEMLGRCSWPRTSVGSRPACWRW